EFVQFVEFDFPAAASDEESPPRQPHARYLALVLHAGQPDDVHLVDLGPADQPRGINDLVARFRASMTGEYAQRNLSRTAPLADQTETHDAGEELRRRVFDPLLPALSGCTRLFLSPDGDLYRLPFEALPDGPAHLIDRYQISYLTTGRDVLRFGQPVGAGD